MLLPNEPSAFDGGGKNIVVSIRSASTEEHVLDTPKRNKIILVPAALIIGLVVAIGLPTNWQKIHAWIAPRPLQLQKLSLAVNPYPGSGLPHLAAAKGYFADEGLEVSFQPYTSGRDSLKASLEKQADLATVADMPVMYATMKKQPVAIVATIFTASRSYGVVARRSSGVVTLADLKDKIIGVTSGTDGHFVLGTLLARDRLLLNQVKLENLAPEEMQAALLSGKVDAISTWEPWLGAASRALGTEAVEFRSDPGFVIEFNLAGRADWVSANQGKIQSLLRALLRAKHFVDEKPKEAHELIAARMKIDPGTFSTGAANYRFVVQLEQNLLITLEDQARWAIQNKFSDQTVVPNFLNAIDMAALTAVQANAVKIVR
ncbi:MAG: NrtA/SsuA/CpmA family ABC transporter substrate-binding protein [Pseudomonadota bacterium]